MPIIDSHIHIDLYKKKDREMIIKQAELYQIKALIAVSNDLSSSKKVHSLKKVYDMIKPAYGYHPEQPLPSENKLIQLVNFIEMNHEEMVAIGEVGLPYYSKKKNKCLKVDAYIDLLENFILLAKKLNKPIVLHAIYDDARIACQLLEKHSVEHAHFHWFKGDISTTERMIANGYHISITPDVLYKEKTRKLVATYPLELLMVETDGPWPFLGPLRSKMTHPMMIHDSIREIAQIKQLQVERVYELLLQTTKLFYGQMEM